MLGALWAEVLCSSPHRKEAIDTLVEALRSLSGDADLLGTVARLGAAIHTAMPVPHRALRIAELVRAMTTGTAADRPSPALVTTLLTALSATTQPVGS